MPLEFKFAEFDRELTSLQKLVGPFLTPEAQAVLAEFHSSLRPIRERPEQKQAWSISRERPIATRRTEGGHEPGGKGVADLYAEISCVWEITPQQPMKKPGQQAKKGTPASTFVLNGLASTLVVLRQESEDDPVAMWRMEVGDDGAPGSWFHAQAGMHGRDDIPFPHSLPVPRLPCYMMTPQAVVEYVIGELFQDEWPQALGKSPAGLTEWAGIQSQRMMATLDWQVRGVRRLEKGTPLATLKALRPVREMYL